VAIVTGAGNGLGKAYAKYLSALGAKVLVNDTGGNRHGLGRETTAADQVVEEIQALNGIAAANYDSVQDGEKVVDAAMKKCL